MTFNRVASAAAVCFVSVVSVGMAQPYPFNNVSLPAAVRAADLVSRLTLREKVGMLFMDASMAYDNNTLPTGGDFPSTAVPRLGVPQFNWMGQGSAFRGAGNGCTIGCCSFCPTNASQCCHDGYATQLPQGTGVAATWNAPLAFALGVMASDEMRGIQNGLPGGPTLADYRTGASSVVNIVRDGRWGRTPETYGECPFLTASIAVALNKGLMGYAALNASTREFGEYIKVIPILRHFTAYNGPDAGRFSFNVVVGEDDLKLTFLPAWETMVREDALGGVMSAISAVNSIPGPAHWSLLVGVLKREWGFKGAVISDCDPVPNIATSLNYTASIEQAVAAALRGGGDINCGSEYSLLNNATEDGLVDETADIDPAVQRALLLRVQSGDLDPPGSPATPYLNIPYSVVNTPANAALARQAVRESVVLLHNDGALPFSVPALRSGGGLAVIGPSADEAAIQAHTYHGTPEEWVTVLGGLQAALNGTGVAITTTPGCARLNNDTSGFAAALRMAETASAILYVGGLEASVEEEDTDRDDFHLPGAQLPLIQALHAVAQARGVPIAVLIISGGPVSEPWLATAPGLAWAWVSYFGEAGGGIADVLLGNYSPSGRLPYTMPVDETQVGDITDYDMRGPPFGRTYRYLTYDAPGAAPLFPFGYGLSYANVSVTALALPQPFANVSATAVPVVATVVNTGPVAADFVVAVYGQFQTCGGGPSPVVAAPLRTLLAFTKLQAVPGDGTPVQTTLTIDLKHTPAAERQALPGWLQLWAGDGGPCAGCPTATLLLTLGAKVCAQPGHAASAGEL